MCPTFLMQFFQASANEVYRFPRSEALPVSWRGGENSKKTILLPQHGMVIRALPPSLQALPKEATFSSVAGWLEVVNLPARHVKRIPVRAGFVCSLLGHLLWCCNRYVGDWTFIYNNLNSWLTRLVSPGGIFHSLTYWKTWTMSLEMSPIISYSLFQLLFSPPTNMRLVLSMFRTFYVEYLKIP